MHPSIFFRLLLWLLAVVLAVVALKSPQGMIFPVGLIAWLEQSRLRRWLAPVPFPLAYFVAGVGLGLITEVFAILGNLQRPPGERILLHPDPPVDLLFGVVYYGLFIAVWYGLLGRWRFSAREVFALSGLFGLATEQAGAIMIGAVTAPLTGIPMALIIACIYGIFPGSAYLLHPPASRSGPVPCGGHIWWRYYVFSCSGLFTGTLYIRDCSFFFPNRKFGLLFPVQQTAQPNKAVQRRERVSQIVCPDAVALRGIKTPALFLQPVKVYI